MLQLINAETSYGNDIVWDNSISEITDSSIRGKRYVCLFGYCPVQK